MELAAPRDRVTHVVPSSLFCATKRGLGISLVLPALVLLVGLVAYPFFYAIYISFTSRIVGDAGHWIGLDNFRIYPGQPLHQDDRNTITLVVVSDILKLGIGLGLALVLNEQIRGRGIFRAFVLLPWAMPGFVAFLVWRLLFTPIGGGINLVLSQPLSTTAISIAGQKSTALPAVIIATVWPGFRSGAFRFWQHCKRCRPSSTKRPRSTAPVRFNGFDRSHCPTYAR